MKSHKKKLLQQCFSANDVIIKRGLCCVFQAASEHSFFNQWNLVELHLEENR